jgi:hypothetical protein
MNAVRRENMKHDQKKLSSFLSALNHYIVPDLVRLRREIRPRAAGKAACTIPTALFAFSILDLLGFLMRPPPAKKEQSEKNIRYACSSAAGLLPPEYDRVSEALVHLFRHGLVHQVFPKASGVSKPNRAGLPLIFYLDGPIPSLNVDRFVDELLAAIREFASLTRKLHFEPLARQVNDRLLRLEKEDYARLRDMQDKGLLKLLKDG